MPETINVAFVGNPNCGKTTLFNAFTGAKLKVANWPGVTVEKKEGTMKFHDEIYNLVDLPGIYSLTSYTMEEKVTRNYILSDAVDVIVDVVDASSLERNLYLAVSLVELGKPVVIALNMMDIVEERGMEIDLHRLPEMLGVPVIPVSARKRTGLNTLMHAVSHHKHEIFDTTVHHHDKSSHVHDHHNEHTMVYSDCIEDKIDKISERLKSKYPDIKNLRWHSLNILSGDEEIINKYKVKSADVIKENLEHEIINQKYLFIEEIINETLVNKDIKSKKTEKADSILTNNVWGMPIFFAIMAFVFFLTFMVGGFLQGYFEMGIEYITKTAPVFLKSIGAGDFITSLIVDGIITGVGGILMFLPNIFILFLALAYLEDSGYMSRVAYVMDSIMGKIGLSGRAFIPMLLGFGCTVPAVMASRTLEDKRDRLKTILVTPFMSCSARLPVYVLFSQMFFGKYAFLAAFAIYLVGVMVAIAVLLILSIMTKKKSEKILLIELPEYKTPNGRTVAIYVWDKIRDYLSRAGTVIFVASVIMWLLLNLGPAGLGDMSKSYGSYLGKFFAPLLVPCGLGYWQIALSLISGVAAKEVVVSSLSVLFGIANITTAEGMASFSGVLGEIGFNGINAFSLMLFCLLYIPCVAALATIRREAGRKWMWGAALLQLSSAWFVSALFFNIAYLITR